MDSSEISKNGRQPTDNGSYELAVIYNGNGATLPRSPSFDPLKPVTLSWHNINVFVKPKQRKFCMFGNKSNTSVQKQLLRDVSGQVKPGQLLAIMGASGAGKTTLLNVLTNRNLTRLNVDGEVLINGQKVGESINRLSSYAQQHDLFIGTLTVKEHLTFQALLRMDKHLSYEDKLRRVDEVISELGLKKCADTLIGIAGMSKGISGGEAKRLTFASEVLTSPSLLFCDEPTSGLDSFMSQSMVGVLRNLAEGGKTIICTIHQPSSEIFELFDHLLFLAEGRVAFLGKASKAPAFFERAGLQCPINYNPADFYIHNLAIVPGNEEETRARLSSICDQFARESLTTATSLSSERSITNSQIRHKFRYTTSSVSQLKTVMWRSWITLIREPLLTKARLVHSIMLSVVIGLVFFQQKYDQKGVMNINGALFLMLLITSFQNLVSVINVFSVEQPIFIREHGNGMYRTDIYFLCKTIVEIPVMIFVTAVFITILYWMIGLYKDYRAYLICLLLQILLGNAAASFGYMISCFANTLSVALSFVTTISMPLILFGGLFINSGSIPSFFNWMKYTSWFYYGSEALAINQWKNVTNISCSNSTTCFHTGKEVLTYLQFNEDDLRLDIGMIVVLAVSYRILAFLALLRKVWVKT